MVVVHLWQLLWGMVALTHGKPIEHRPVHSNGLMCVDPYQETSVEPCQSKGPEKSPASQIPLSVL